MNPQSLQPRVIQRTEATDFAAFDFLVEDFAMRLIARFMKDESGATAIEYGLIAGLIGVVVITAVTNVGTKVSNQFKTIGNALK